MYAQDNDGELPSDWKDLDEYLRSREKGASAGDDRRSHFFEAFERQLGGTVEEKFMLVTGLGIAMAGQDGSSRFDSGIVIAVTSSPIGEDRRDGAGRYVIWKNKSGGMRSTWTGESLVKNQFRKAGVELKTGPINVQPPTFDKEFERRVVLIALVLVAVAVLLIFGIKRLRPRSGGF